MYELINSKLDVRVIETKRGPGIADNKILCEISLGGQVIRRDWIKIKPEQMKRLNPLGCLDHNDLRDAMVAKLGKLANGQNLVDLHGRVLQFDGLSRQVRELFERDVVGLEDELKISFEGCVYALVELAGSILTKHKLVKDDETRGGNGKGDQG